LFKKRCGARAEPGVIITEENVSSNSRGDGFFQFVSPTGHLLGFALNVFPIADKPDIAALPLASPTLSYFFLTIQEHPFTFRKTLMFSF
jgi:hypothetical protein